MTTAVRKDPGERMNSMVEVDEDALTSTTSTKLTAATTTKATTDVSHEARRGMLQTLIMPGMATKFSSRPIQVPEDNENETNTESSGPIVPATNSKSATEHVVSSSNKGPYLTASEKKYLESLLQSNDPDAIRRASDRLSDVSLFPRSEPDETVSKNNVENSTTSTKKNQHPKLHHRDSELQRSLFRFHEEAKVRPSTLLKRLSQHRARSGGLGRNASPVDFDSICETKTEDVLPYTESSWDMDEEKKSSEKDEDLALEHEKAITDAEWDDLMNAAAWITAESGDSIEVNDEGSPMLAHSNATSAFQVLGTSAQDTSCFPHVLSPPIMEGLLAFVPESLTENSNFWLKYSLVRDGPGLLKMLRHVRASNHTVLAIETTDGHVFGAFASRPWRLSNGYFGSSDSFLFRMRHSRNKHCTTVVEQALLETELEFFPYTNMNNSVQRCTRDGISIGSTELSNTGCDHQEKGGDIHRHHHDGGEYFGSALSLDKTLLSGTTSSSETFGNPCLTHSSKLGCEFEVANVEVWTLTPHDTVGEAENEEMEALFFEETYSRDNKKLDLLGILVGTPYGQVHA